MDLDSLCISGYVYNVLKGFIVILVKNARVAQLVFEFYMGFTIFQTLLKLEHIFFIFLFVLLFKVARKKVFSKFDQQFETCSSSYIFPPFIQKTNLKTFLRTSKLLQQHQQHEQEQQQQQQHQ